MKRIGFSDKRSHRIKEWAETNIVHLTIVCQAYKWKKLKIVHLLTPYVNEIGYCYRNHILESALYKAMILHTFLETVKMI